MNTVRRLALAVAVASVAAEAVNGASQDEVVGALPEVPRDDTCAELPKLCTGSAMMYGYATTVTYLCPVTTREPVTVHVTITRTTTVTPLEVETTPTGTTLIDFPVPTLTEEPDVTTTIRSTLTEYKTITLVANTDTATPIDAVSASAVPITGYLSATVPTELLSFATRLPTETDGSQYTIQTSTPATTSGYDFPTMSSPVVNGTTTGILYSQPIANSSIAHPTPFFPNTTVAHSHYALPTLNVANRAAETTELTKGAADRVIISFGAAISSIFAVAFVVQASL